MNAYQIDGCLLLLLCPEIARRVVETGKGKQRLSPGPVGSSGRKLFGGESRCEETYQGTQGKSSRGFEVIGNRDLLCASR